MGALFIGPFKLIVALAFVVALFASGDNPVGKATQVAETLVTILMAIYAAVATALVGALF